MRYSSFYLKNYKGINELTLNVDNDRILTLVGLNESGKTTILEGVFTFYQCIKGNEPDSAKLNEIRPKGINFSDSVVIKAKFVLDQSDKDKINAFYKELNKRYTLDIPNQLTYTFEFVYKTHTYKNTKKLYDFPIKAINTKGNVTKIDDEIVTKILGFIKENLIPEILYYEDFIFEIPKEIIFVKNPSDADTEKVQTLLTNKKNQQWKDVLDDILKNVDPQLTSFQSYVANLWDSDNSTASNRISMMERLLNEKITKGWKELFKKQDGSESRLNFKEIRVVPVTESNELRISFRIKNDSGKEFLINERSKGFNWFFSFLIFTEFRKSRSNNILFLLDEPASNLHSSAQVKILEAIGQLSDKSLVIYSTHSHHLINPNWLNGAYVVINDSMSTEQLGGAFNDSIEAQQITAKKYYNYVAQSGQSISPVLFQPILDRLDYAPSQIEPVPNIIITEGKYDWYTYKYLSEIILNDPFSYNFYPGTGCNQHWDIIKLYLSWGKKFVLVLDSDAGGKEAKENYLQEFDGIVNGSIFDYSDIFQKDIQTEDLINDDDKKKICDGAFGVGTYDGVKNDKDALKSKLNFAINQLLVKKIVIEISQDTKDNFTKLFDFLKNKIQT